MGGRFLPMRVVRATRRGPEHGLRHVEIEFTVEFDGRDGGVRVECRRGRCGVPQHAGDVAVAAGDFPVAAGDVRGQLLTGPRTVTHLTSLRRPRTETVSPGAPE
ncbi:hypothetical protein SY2F82_41980 [Streptomyces sp. Y2F8-2]|nr:hypothetical protein SY2F82_41980 [Streptomyces sp. Y2F8-2]